MNDQENKITDKKLFGEFPPVSTVEWEELILKDLKGQDYEKKLVWHLHDGIKIKPYYREENLSPISYLESNGGLLNCRSGKTDNSWSKHQAVKVDQIKEANSLALKLIENGADSICFNSSRILSASVLAELLRGIDPTAISISFAQSDCFRDQITFFIEFLDKNHFDLKNVKGYLNVDPFSNLLINGKFPDSLETVKERLFSIHNLVYKNLPEYDFLNIRGYVFHNAGATAAQELAYTISSANEYLVLLSGLGFSADDILKHIRFNFAIGPDYFIEIAKIRAARILWSAIAAEYQQDKSQNVSMFISSVSSEWNKAIYDPYTNMLRLTTEAMSAIIGGADSVELRPFDILYKKQNEFSLVNAMNIQNLLKEESKFDKVLDPSAGSYYIENLTHIFAEKAWNIFLEIEKQGGFLESVKNGYVQAEIKKVAEITKKEVLARKDKILGVNIFPDINETAMDDIELELKEDSTPETIEIEPLILSRKAKIFENIRLRTEKFIKAGGKQPVVSLVPVGNPAMSSARSMFSRNFFGVSGFKIIENNRFTDIDEGITTLVTQQPDMIVICSSDEEYKEYADKLIGKMKGVSLKPFTIVAGYPAEIINDLKEMGVNDFIHLKSDILGTIENYQKLFGIK